MNLTNRDIFEFLVLHDLNVFEKLISSRVFTDDEARQLCQAFMKVCMSSLYAERYILLLHDIGVLYPNIGAQKIAAAMMKHLTAQYGQQTPQMEYVCKVIAAPVSIRQNQQMIQQLREAIRTL